MINGREAEPVEIPKAVPGNGEVRVKVMASAVNPAEEKVMGGEFAGRFLHAKNSHWYWAGTLPG